MRDFFRFRQGAQFRDHNCCVIPRQMSKEELRKRIERDPPRRISISLNMRSHDGRILGRLAVSLGAPLDHAILARLDR